MVKKASSVNKNRNDNDRVVVSFYLFDLSPNILKLILGEYTKFSDLGRFDSATTNKKDRYQLHRKVLAGSSTVHFNGKTIRGLLSLSWLITRDIEAREFGFSGNGLNCELSLHSLLTGEIDELRINIACYLIKNSTVNLNYQNNEGSSFLHIAANLGCIKIVRALLLTIPKLKSSKVSKKSSPRKNALSRICKVDIEDNEKFTPMHRALFKKHSRIVSLLIANDCNITKPIGMKKEVHTGKYPIHLALSCFRTAQLLVNSGVDTNVQDEEGNTPLHYALFNKEKTLDMIKLLCVQGKASLQIKNHSQQTPKELAMSLKDRFPATIMGKVVDLLEQLENGHIFLAEFRFFSELPKRIFKEIIGNWLDPEEVTILDTACSDKIYSTNAVETCARNKLLTSYQGLSSVAFDNFRFHTAGSILWLHSRGIVLNKLQLAKQILGHPKRSLIHWAVENNMTSLFKLAMKLKSIDIETPDPCTRNGTVLHIACAEGHHDLFHILLKKFGSCVIAKDDVGRTPLHYACLAGHNHIVNHLLVTYGANISILDCGGMSPLHIAVWKGNNEITEILLKYLVGNCLQPIPTSGFFISNKTSNGSSTENQSIRETRKKKCNKQENENSIVASTKRIVLEVVSSDINGWSPLHFACHYKHGHMVQMLLQYDFVVNNLHAQTNDGLTVIFLCAKNNFIVGLEFIYNSTISTSFLTLDTIVNIPNYEGSTPLYAAAECGHIEICRLLIDKYESKIDNQNNVGNTVLHIASENGHEDVVRLLLMHCTTKQINILNFAGNTALNHAHWRGHESIIQLFLEHKDNHL